MSQLSRNRLPQLCGRRFSILDKLQKPSIDISLQFRYNIHKRSTSVLGRRHIYGKENHHHQP